MNRNDTQLQAAKPLGTVAPRVPHGYRSRQFCCRKTAPCISAQNPPRLGYKDERAGYKIVYNSTTASAGKGGITI